MIICNYSIRIIAARVYLCDVQIHFYSNEPFCVNYDQSRQVFRSLSGVLVPLVCSSGWHSLRCWRDLGTHVPQPRAVMPGSEGKGLAARGPGRR